MAHRARSSDSDSDFKKKCDITPRTADCKILKPGSNLRSPSPTCWNWNRQAKRSPNPKPQCPVSNMQDARCKGISPPWFFYQRTKVGCYRQPRIPVTDHPRIQGYRQWAFTGVFHGRGPAGALGWFLCGGLVCRCPWFLCGGWSWAIAVYRTCRIPHGRSASAEYRAHAADAAPG